jgi:predicted metal-dependent HD superfamily phosphohydrolase
MTSDLVRLAGPAVLDDLRGRYAEPHRAYHVWAHVQALLGWADGLGDALLDRGMVDAAILFHDAVYDPRRSDNEARSAALLAGCADLSLTGTQRRDAECLVLATAAHLPPKDLDTALRSDLELFLDMDLSILGATREKFDVYERRVRFEYAHVADDDFAHGRCAVLTSFLNRPTLYFSVWGRDMFEAQARRNIDRSLNRARWPLAEALH